MRISRSLPVLLALIALPVLPSGASDPSSGKVSPTITRLTYQGEVGVGAPASALGPVSCLEGATCDTFDLTVDVPGNFYASNKRVLTATITWADSANDLDLYFCEGTASDDPQCVNGEVTSAASSGGKVETLTVENPAPGSYRVIAKAYAGSSTYAGLITFTAPAAAASSILAFKPAEQLSGLSYDSLALKRAGGEPAIAISPSGKTMIVAGLGPASPAALFRSTDAGKTYKELHPSFPMSGGGDWDMYLLDDTHVVAADLTIGDGIYIHRSSDAGDHWTSTRILTDQYDRPWLDHFGKDIVYVVAKGFDGIPYLYTSTDGGSSFGTPPIPMIVYGVPGQGGPDPVTGIVTNTDAYFDHLVVDQKSGDVYGLYGISYPDTINPDQPAGASNHLYVAHLEDGRMVSYPVYIGGAEDSFLSGFNWMAVDGAGTLYVLIDGRIDGHHSARLAYSKDHGHTWSKLVDVAPPGAANVYGAIAAEKPGVLALAYIRGTTEDPGEQQPWYATMGRITGADTPSPKVTHVRALAKPIHLVDICFDGIVCGLPGFGVDRNLLDYIWVSVDAQGRAWGIFSSDGPATGSSNSESPDVLVLRQKGSALKTIAKPATKPRVLPGKITPGAALPGTGVGEESLLFGAVASALAAGLATRLRKHR